MLRYLPTLLVATALGVGVWQLVSLVQDRAEKAAELERARIELASKDAALEQAAEAARVHRAYLERWAADQARWNEIEREMQSMEGRDAPLSALLQSAADRLYGR